MTALPVREMTEPKPKHIEKPTSPPNAAQAPQKIAQKKIQVMIM